MENLKAKILEVLEDMDEWDKICLWNEYKRETNSFDDCVYSMNEFDEIMDGMHPWEVARCCYYSGKFCPAHEYFMFNGYGNAVSSDYLDDLIYLDDLADHLADTRNAYENEELQALFDELEEMNENEQED